MSLGDGLFGDQGCEALAQALAANPRLEELSLRGNLGITSRGAHALLQGATASSSLVALDLGGRASGLVDPEAASGRQEIEEMRAQQLARAVGAVGPNIKLKAKNGKKGDKKRPGRNKKKGEAAEDAAEAADRHGRRLELAGLVMPPTSAAVVAEKEHEVTSNSDDDDDDDHNNNNNNKNATSAAAVAALVKVGKHVEVELDGEVMDALAGVLARNQGWQPLIRRIQSLEAEVMHLRQQRGGGSGGTGGTTASGNSGSDPTAATTAPPKEKPKEEL